MHGSDHTESMYTSQKLNRPVLQRQVHDCCGRASPQQLRVALRDRFGVSTVEFRVNADGLATKGTISKICYGPSGVPGVSGGGGTGVAY